MYFTDPAHKRVWFIDAGRNKRVVHEGIAFPNGIRFSPDQSYLMVTDSAGRRVWSFLVQSDGSLVNGVPFHRLEIPDEMESGTLRSGADGFTVDSEGFLYVATKIGIQMICAPAGRVPGTTSRWSDAAVGVEAEGRAAPRYPSAEQTPRPDGEAYQVGQWY